MRNLSALSDIVGLIFEATVSPSVWDDVCDRIVDLSDATVFMVFEYDLTKHLGSHVYGSKLTRNLGAPLVRAMREGDAEEDKTGYERMAFFPAGRLIPEYQVWGVSHDTEMPRNENREAVLSAGGSKSRNVARLNEIGPWMDIAALHSRCFGADIGPKTLENLNFLLPLIGKALETQRLLRNLTDKFGMLLDAFDMFDFAAAFCAPSGQLLLANQRMRNALRDKDAVLSSANDVITAADPAYRPKFVSMLANSVRPATPPGGTWLQLGRRSGRPPYVAKVAPVKEPEVGHTQTVLLMLADPEDDSRVHAEGLAVFGLLTPAELDVCRWILRGTHTAEIAERRSASTETIRSQIKSASSKLACHSRLDLLRIALATSLPRTLTRSLEDIELN